MRKRLIGFLLAAAVWSLPAFAQLPQYDRLLLPITVREIPGAFGSVWNTELWLRVTTPLSSISINPYISAGDACDPPCGGGVVTPDNPLYSFPLGFYRTHPGETSGSLLYITKGKIDNVHVSLRLSNGMAGSDPVELPVVPERLFTADPLYILGIPLRSSARAMVRVYGIDPDMLGSVRVKAFAESPTGSANTVVLDTVVPLTVTQQFTRGVDPLPLRPSVAELNLSALIQSAFPLVRLEITPVEPGLRLWAFVSVTDNDRQTVVLRTPS